MPIKFLTRSRELIHNNLKNILNFFDHTYKNINDYTFDKVDPLLIKYFKTEYGQDWQSALTEHLYKKESSIAKKAA